MKHLLAVTILALLLTSCGNNDEQTKEDTTNLDTMSVPNTPAVQENALMTAMNNMMNDMHSMQMSGNVDKDFAMMMKRHHQAAVDMANYELQHGRDSTVKNMARMLIEKQTKENQELEALANSASSATTDSSFNSKGMEGMMKTHQQSISAPMIGDPDKDFVSMMIPHHRGAIDMSQLYLKSGKNEKLKAMASKMISDQKKEIDEMNKWLQSQEKDEAAR